MIAKLMSRKKSYERIMKLEDPLQGRSPSVLHPDLSSKKNTEVLLTANRGGVSSLSRAQVSNSTRKQLQYYESTPQQRKHGSVIKKGLTNSGSNQGGLLDVTG